MELPVDELVECVFDLEGASDALSCTTVVSEVVAQAGPEIALSCTTVVSEVVAEADPEMAQSHGPDGQDPGTPSLHQIQSWQDVLKNLGDDRILRTNRRGASESSREGLPPLVPPPEGILVMAPWGPTRSVPGTHIPLQLCKRLSFKSPPTVRPAEEDAAGAEEEPARLASLPARPLRPPPPPPPGGSTSSRPIHSVPPIAKAVPKKAPPQCPVRTEENAAGAEEEPAGSAGVPVANPAQPLAETVAMAPPAGVPAANPAQPVAGAVAIVAPPAAVPAVNPAQPVAGALAIWYPPATDAQADEIRDLRSDPAWTAFTARVEEAITGAPRVALAQHTTTSNQPGNQAGTCGSLNGCGADQRHPQANGLHCCRIRLPNLLRSGDGIVLHYTSGYYLRFKDAQKAAFVEILSYILFRGPQHLRNHVNQWHALDALKDYWLGVLRNDLGPRPGGLAWSQVEAGPAAAATQRPGPGPAPGPGYDYVPPAEGEDPREREGRILDALWRVPRLRWNYGEMPADVWPVLRREIPPGGLGEFLMRFPQWFVIDSNVPLVWKRR